MLWDGDPISDLDIGDSLKRIKQEMVLCQPRYSSVENSDLKNYFNNSNNLFQDAKLGR
jgi:hypothetical protein